MATTTPQKTKAPTTASKTGTTGRRAASGTTAAKRSRLSPEQRKEREAELRTVQRAAVEALMNDGDAWRRYLAAGRLFRSYSPGNVALILAQCPHATRVAGFSVWKKLGRKVTSGPGSSLKIWGKPYRPSIWREASEVGEGVPIFERDGSRVKVPAPWTYCPVLSVFDVSQTEGEPLPEVVHMLDGGSAGEVERASEVAGLVEAWLVGQGWDVGAEPMNGPNGYTDHKGRRVRLAEGLAPRQRTKTLLHEAAHVVLHGDDTWVSMERYRGSVLHRGLAEVQAESVAFMVAGMLGLDTGEYSTGYVAHWASAAAGTDSVDDAVAIVERTAAAVSHGMGALMDAIEGKQVEVSAEGAVGERVA